MKLTIIILNWNAATDTIRCVRQIASWQRIKPSIVIVDNASSDGSVEKITRACPQIHLIRNASNQGFAGGNNRGIEAALSMGNAPIMLLNNDAVIAETDAIRLLETLEADPKIGFVGPLLFDAKQPDRLLSAGSKDPSRHHHSHNHKLPDGGPLHVVECIPGTVIMGRAEVFRAVGLLDEAYFFGSEVADLCMLAQKQGYSSVIDSQARAYHTLERSSTFRKTLYPYYIIRNRFLLIRKFHRSWKPLFYSFWSLYSLALSLKVGLSGQKSTARAVWLGCLDGLRGNFGNQNQRALAFISGAATATETNV